jgi:hypothetical protein
MPDDSTPDQNPPDFWGRGPSPSDTLKRSEVTLGPRQVSPEFDPYAGNASPLAELAPPMDSPASFRPGPDGTIIGSDNLFYTPTRWVDGHNNRVYSASLGEDTHYFLLGLEGRTEVRVDLLSLHGTARNTFITDGENIWGVAGNSRGKVVKYNRRGERYRRDQHYEVFRDGSDKPFIVMDRAYTKILVVDVVQPQTVGVQAGESSRAGPGYAGGPDRPQRRPGREYSGTSGHPVQARPIPIQRDRGSELPPRAKTPESIPSHATEPGWTR